MEVRGKKKVISSSLNFISCSPLSSSGKVNEVEGEIMHMDVKQPAKLGVRFNWCKYLVGWLAASTSSTGLSSAGGQSLHEAGTTAVSSGVQN